MILQKKTFAAMHSHGICGATVEERLNTVLKCVELPLRMRRFRMWPGASFVIFKKEVDGEKITCINIGLRMILFGAWFADHLRGRGGVHFVGCVGQHLATTFS